MFLVDLDDVSVLHFQLLGCLVVVDASTIEQESQRVDGHALAVTVGFLELAQAGRILDLEMDLAVVLSDDLELDVLVTTWNERTTTKPSSGLKSSLSNSFFCLNNSTYLLVLLDRQTFCQKIIT